MIYIIYLVLAALTVFFSIKGAGYVDNIDNKTNISGAFIGGVILAAVTSLPELITSLTSTLLIKNPDYVVGNILGSNLFNLAIIGVIILFCSKGFAKSNVGNAHFLTCLFTIVMYAAVAFPILFEKDFMFFTVSIISVIIIVLYVFSVRSLAADDASSDSDSDDCKLTVKQLVTRFILVSIALVAASVMITYVTDIIALKLNLGKTLAGALFLGIATSLPELSSSIALAKRKNFNALTGNILGSNCFNFIIFAAADISYFKGSVYQTADAVAHSQSVLLIIFGIISSLAAVLILLFKRKGISKRAAYILPAAVISASYLIFLCLSV